MLSDGKEKREEKGRIPTDERSSSSNQFKLSQIIFDLSPLKTHSYSDTKRSSCERKQENICLENWTRDLIGWPEVCLLLQLLFPLQ